MLENEKGEYRISLKEYLERRNAGIVDKLAEKEIVAEASIVFGSAVNGKEKRNPEEWDVDVLYIVDNISAFRENGDEHISLGINEDYIPVVQPTGQVMELQEKDSMGVHGPKKGLHIQIVEASAITPEFLETEETFRNAFSQGVCIRGELPDNVVAACEELNIDTTKMNSDDIDWGGITYQTPSKNRLI